MKYLSILIVGVALLVGGYGETKTEVLYHEDGSKKSETIYVESEKHGTALWYFVDGSTKTSEFVHGTGTEIWYHEDGSKWYEALWVNGKRHGTLISYYKDGSKESEIPYVNGKAHGVEINYNRDGSTWTEEYKEDESVAGSKNGTKIDYNEDGSKKEEIVFKNGKEIFIKRF